MYRISICLILIAIFGCSTETVENSANRGSDAEVEDGGVVENADRDRAESFFVSLRKIETVEEEEKLLKDFGNWLRGKEYKIKVAVKNGSHVLSCPYFPPVTPWTIHSFHDIKNLELLPQLDDDE